MSSPLHTLTSTSPASRAFLSHAPDEIVPALFQPGAMPLDPADASAEPFALPTVSEAVETLSAIVREEGATEDCLQAVEILGRIASRQQSHRENFRAVDALLWAANEGENRQVARLAGQVVGELLRWSVYPVAPVLPLLEQMQRAAEEQEWDLALDAGLQVAERIPWHAHTRYKIGLYREQQGDFRGAYADYREAARLRPDWGVIFRVLGGTSGRLGELNPSLDYLNEAIRLSPDDDLAYYFRGLTLDRLKRVNEARRDYEKAVELDPRDVQYLHALSSLMGRLGDWGEAARLDRRVTELEPGDAAHWVRLAVSLEYGGDYEESARMFFEAYRRDPTHPHVAHYQGAGLLPTTPYES